MSLLELKIEERDDGFTFSHEAMATNLTLWIGGVEQSYAKGAAYDYFQCVDDLESKLSLYQESSDVTRINLLGMGEIAKVSTECVECLLQALEASALTGSFFHPFLGVESLRMKGKVPPFLSSLVTGESGNAEAFIQLDPESRLVKKVGDGNLLDLGGIGKGYALDAALEALEDWDIPMLMANFGGSTILFRDECSELKWRGMLGQTAIDISGEEAIASSGVGYQGEHIVSNQPIEGGSRWLRSFVRCPSAAMADALSTAAILMNETQLEALSKGEPNIRLAVSSESTDWGVNAFCERASL